MIKEVILWRNQELIAVVVEVGAVEVVEKSKTRPLKPAILLGVVAAMPHQNASNWPVLTAVSLFPVNTSANK